MTNPSDMDHESKLVTYYTVMSLQAIITSHIEFNHNHKGTIFPLTSEGFFPRGATAVKFYFINSETKKDIFSTETLIAKYQISKPRGLSPFRRSCIRRAGLTKCDGKHVCGTPLSGVCRNFEEGHQVTIIGA